MTTEEKDRFAFDSFPRGTLAMQLSRRTFWSALKTEFLVHAGQREGRKAFKLADLGNWTDEQLAGVIPIVAPGCEISVRDGSVWGRPAGFRRPVQLFPASSPAVAVFNRMNGQISLEENARCLEVEMGWDNRRSFAYVRGVFLWLVLARVCIPKESG